MSSEINPASSVLRPTIVRDASDCKIQPKAVRKVSAIAKEPIQRIGSLSSAVNFKKWERFPDSSNRIRYHPPTREMTAGLYDLCSSGKSHQAEPKRVRWKLNRKIILGKGAFATVHPMVEVRTGKPCVGKVNFPAVEACSLAEEEYQNLRHWQGIPHIVHVEGGLNISGSEKLIIMEQVEPSLFQHVMKCKIPFLDIVLIFKQFLEMHREAAARGLVHGDLKLENAAYKLGKLTIYDLGLARKKAYCIFRGTLRYLAPEMLLGKSFGPSTDLWSIGIILYSLFLNKQFTSENKKTIIQEIVKQIGLPSDEYLKDCPCKELFVKSNEPPTLEGILKAEAAKRGLPEIAAGQFINLLMRILRFEERISADEALELCNQIDCKLSPKTDLLEEKKT